MNEPQSSSWILELRNRLGTPPARRLPPTDDRQAAVLVPLYVDAGELWTVLTQRTDKLPHHSGAERPFGATVQIAFPGGSLEPGEDPWDAAVRETEEEIGIERKKILRLGDLDETAVSHSPPSGGTPSDFRIVPCVGAVPFPLETELNTDEIEELFVLPIKAFANPTAVEERAVTLDGEERMLRIYHVGSRQVWGLTAMILQNLLQRLGLEPVEPPN